MPNWTTNEVTFSSAKTTNIKKIKDIFYKGCPFNQLIEEPNWSTVPLKGNEKRNSFEDKPLGKVGELPITEEFKLNNGEVMTLSKFKSTDVQDTRWYDWRLQNWDTKWDVPKDEIEITELDGIFDKESTHAKTDIKGNFIKGHTIVISFSTAWSAPYAIYKFIKNKWCNFNNGVTHLDWWARDEDDDTNGEGYYLK